MRATVGFILIRLETSVCIWNLTHACALWKLYKHITTFCLVQLSTKTECVCMHEQRWLAVSDLCHTTHAARTCPIESDTIMRHMFMIRRKVTVLGMTSTMNYLSAINGASDSRSKTHGYDQGKCGILWNHCTYNFLFVMPLFVRRMWCKLTQACCRKSRIQKADVLAARKILKQFCHHLFVVLKAPGTFTRHKNMPTIEKKSRC